MPLHIKINAKNLRTVHVCSDRKRVRETSFTYAALAALERNHLMIVLKPSFFKELTNIGGRNNVPTRTVLSPNLSRLDTLVNGLRCDPKNLGSIDRRD